MVNDSLHKENVAKDKEIRRLNKDVQQYEQTIISLRNKMAHNVDVNMRDAEVMAEMCGVGNDCGDWEPVKDYSEMLREETISYQNRIRKMEMDLKSTCKNVRTLRKLNAELTEELNAMRHVCAAFDDQCRTITARTQLKDDVIREMRCQLKQAKSKVSKSHMTSGGSQLMSHDVTIVTPDVSIIRRTSSAPIVIDDSEHQLPGNSAVTPPRLHSTIHIQSPETASLKADEILFDQSDRKQTSAEGEASLREHAQEFQESGCSWSETGSAGGRCTAEERADYYHQKLLATLHILQNSEETVRVQAESLRLAEGRISALTDRAAEMRLDITRKAHQLRSLQAAADEDKTEKTDVSVTAEIQEQRSHKIVSALQSNLSVIEELYTECFYEAAKQEQLIEMLRSSYLDVRLMDKQKAEHIERLQSVVHSQKWSLERCQDIAVEVDSLKVEISNFLNNSNNDSGMWEREDSLSTEVFEELHDITAQLLQLREMLTGDCTCGLAEENKTLKESQHTMEIQVVELRQRLAEAETALIDKQNMDDIYKQQIDNRDEQLKDLRQQLSTLKEGAKNQSTACDSLSRQLQQTQVLLRDKSAELVEVQRQCDTHHQTIVMLNEELDKTKHTIKENAKVRTEVSQLTGQVSRWREQLTDSEQRLQLLERELQRARSHCRDVDHCYREQSQSVSVLQSQLEEAQGRGAALCEEARLVVGTVRDWVRRMRITHREQGNKIKEQDILIKSLQQRVTEKHGEDRRQEAEPCSTCGGREPSRVDTTGPSCSRVEERCEEMQRLSESEIASCSSAPTPPRRLLKKWPTCGDRRCCATGSFGAQQPARRGVAVERTRPTTPLCDCERTLTTRHARVMGSPFQREISPTEELYERVEQLYEAFDSGHRRWSRGRAASHSR